MTSIGTSNTFDTYFANLIATTNANEMILIRDDATPSSPRRCRTTNKKSKAQNQDKVHDRWTRHQTEQKLSNINQSTTSFSSLSSPSSRSLSLTLSRSRSSPHCSSPSSSLSSKRPPTRPTRKPSFDDIFDSFDSSSSSLPPLPRRRRPILVVNSQWKTDPSRTHGNMITTATNETDLSPITKLLSLGHQPRLNTSTVKSRKYASCLISRDTTTPFNNTMSSTEQNGGTTVTCTNGENDDVRNIVTTDRKQKLRTFLDEVGYVLDDTTYHQDSDSGDDRWSVESYEY